MAAVNSMHRYAGTLPNLEKVRTAPPARSRIPVSQPGQTTKKDGLRHQSAPTGQLTRLEMMQNDFQQKLLVEKEEKMIGIYEQNQQQALRRVSGKERGESGGMVRDFFKERRAMEQNGKQGTLSRDMHFKKKKKEREKEMEIEEAKTQQMVEYQRKVALQQQAQYHQQQQQHHQQQQNQQQHYQQQRQQPQHQQPQPHQQPQQHSQQQRHQPKTPPHQQQVPKRSKPLAPIRQQSTRNKNHFKPPSPEGVYETTDSISYDVDDHSNEPSPQLQRKKPFAPARQTLKPIGSKAKAKVPDRDPREQNGPQRKKVATIPAQRQVGNVQRKAPPQQTHKKEKLTDFQKFQMERDQERQDRLDKHREKQKPSMFAEEGDSSFEYDRETHEKRNAQKRRGKDYDDIKRKEAELEALIAKHQADLARLQSSEENLNQSDDWSAPPPQPHPPSQPMRTNKVLVRRQSRIEPESPQHERSSVMSQNDRQLPRSQPQTKQPDETFSNKPIKVPQRKPSQKRKPQTVPPPRRTPSPPPLNAEVSFYEQSIQNLGPEPELDLRGCPNCGRRFAADRLDKHFNVCKKQSKAAKKRKVFDMTKKRNEGMEQLQYVKHGQHLKDNTPPKKSNWKKKHEEFIRAVRDARTTQDYINKGGNLADLPPPPPAENPDYVQCPWCSRRFAPGTAERHIPKCKDTKSRPRGPPTKFNSKRR